MDDKIHPDSFLIMKKYLIHILIICFLTFTTNVKADIDTQNMVGTTIASAGALTTFMAVAGGSAVVVGTGGLALALLGVGILLSNNTDEGQAPSTAPISIRLNPNIPLVTPQGWVNDTTPPNTTTFEQTWQSGTQTGFATSQEATLAQWNTNAFHCSPPKVCTVGNLVVLSPTLHRYTVYSNGGTQGTLNATLTSTCPLGYSLQNSQCVLTNQALVKKPVKGLMEVKRVGNTFQTDPQINPKDILPNEVATVTSDQVTVNDSTGSRTEIKINPDGTTNVSVSKPQTDGTTKKTTTQFSAPDPSTGNVEVIGNATESINGNGTLQTTGGSNLDISSLNKESTQQSISNKLSEILNAQCGGTGQPPCSTILDETGSPTNIDSTSQGVIDTLDGASTQFTNQVNSQTAPTSDNGSDNNPLSSVPTSSCSPLPITGWSVIPSFNLDPCPVANAVLPIIDWMFKILVAIYIVLRFRSVTSGVPE
jgi:hypothetical protein